MKYTTVDANFLKFFYEQSLKDEAGDFVTAFEKILARGNLAIDDKGKAMQEYDDCMKPPAVGAGLKEYVTSLMEAGKVAVVPLNNVCDKPLRLLGVPRKDIKWVAISCSAGADILATEDIDLFEPSEKGCSGERARKIKTGGKGKVCKHCKKKYGIHIVCCEIVESKIDELDG